MEMEKKNKEEKLKNEERTFGPFFFFSFFFLFTFQNDWNYFGSTKMEIFYQEKPFHARKKSDQEKWLCPSENFPVTPLQSSMLGADILNNPRNKYYSRSSNYSQRIHLSPKHQSGKFQCSWRLNLCNKYKPCCPRLQAVTNKMTRQSLIDGTNKYTCKCLLVRHHRDLPTHHMRHGMTNTSPTYIVYDEWHS